jgi:ribonuclease-3
MSVKKSNGDRQELFNAKSVVNWFKDGDFKNHIINEKNKPITKEFIEGVFKKYNVNHKVKNLENFQLAMVHISYVNRTTLTEKTAKLLKDVIPILDKDKPHAMPLKEESYNKLEFLGDSICHAIIARYLYDRYPTENEGFYTSLRSKIECSERFAFLSKKIGLPQFSIVARNIDQSNGRETNTHLCEDIIEAFFGALSLEASYDKCKEFLINVIEAEIDMAELINNNDNYKDRLMQEFHKLKWSDPKYIEDVSQQKNIKEGCQEIRSFTIYVKNPKGEIIGMGVAPSKPKSEQLAAYNSLITMGIIKDTNDDDNNSDYYGEISSDEDIDNKHKHGGSDESSENSSDYFEE